MSVAADKRQSVLQEMRDRGLPLTADSYAVWHAYRLGADTRLRRAVDVLLGNGRVLDDVAMHGLNAQYCASRQETEALREAASRARGTVQALSGFLGEMQGAAVEYGESLRAATMALRLPPEDVTALARRLSHETQEMIGHSETLLERLGESTERIAELELFLQEARREAATDTLTGLANRRAFDEALRKLAAEAMNTGEPLAVLLADVDHFKSVNDTYGHDAGDQVLRLVAAAMRQSVRGRDIVARYGGEEFVLALPDTTPHGALAVAENLREAVAQCRVPVAGDREIGVTISVGVSLYDVGEKVGDSLARADAALYQAKQQGRDRAVLRCAGPCAERPGVAECARLAVAAQFAPLA